MFGRIALAAAFLTGVLALAEAHAEVRIAAAAPVVTKAAEAPAAEAPAEQGTCRKVKIVYAGHGEAERSPCRVR